MRRLRNRVRGTVAEVDTFREYQEPEHNGLAGVYVVSAPALKGFLRVALTIAIAYVAWVFIGRYTHPPRRVVQIDEGKGAREAEWQRTYGGNSVKILQFYASESSATQGSKSLICYGVLNAKSVRIEPLRDVVSPSLNRCVEIAPIKDTR
jgi:hypothetical protein